MTSGRRHERYRVGIPPGAARPGGIGGGSGADPIPARAGATTAEGLEDGGKVPGPTKGTATLRDMRQFSAPRSVPICRGDDQQTRLVPILRRAVGSRVTGGSVTEGSVTGGSVTRGLHAA